MNVTKSTKYTPYHHHWSWNLLLYELRYSISWSWLLPLLISAGSLLLSKLTYISPRPEDSASGTLFINYAFNMRHDMEVLLPLCTIILCAQIMAQERQQGMLGLLTLRKPIAGLLYIRIFYLFLYLSIWTILATFVSWLLTSSLPEIHATLWQWIWDSCVTVLPASWSMGLFCLLISNLCISSKAGYITGTLLWLFSLLLLLLLTQQPEHNNVAFYLPFSWCTRMLTIHPQNWWQSKCIYLGITFLLLPIQALAVHNEARMLRNFEE